jgi:hypothetical protein
MQLAVAGFDQDAIRERTRRLAGGDWSDFTPSAFARKLASGGTSARDFEDLAAHLGRERAIDVLWWSCQCQYMTLVADAFQLPLETENVFDGFRSTGKAPSP